jgi:hypothetical protein
MAKMAKAPEPTSKYQEQFRKHFDEIDELALSVLKAHLIVESALDNIISLIFFHPSLVLGMRPGFHLKLQMVRAYAIQEQNYSIWKLMAATNELRNAIAHELEGERREQKMEAVRQMYLNQVEDSLAQDHKNYPDHLIVVLACSLCAGFLGQMEEDIAALRGAINAMTAAIPKKNTDGSKPRPAKRGE